nr:hypothetical protein [Tanacetum cinerariifolium]
MNLLNEGCSANPPAQNQPFPGYSSQYASMTPEQFQQHHQEQQQAFFPIATITIDSPKNDGRKKTKSKRGKNVEDEPVAAGRWLPIEEELLSTCYVAVSEDNNVGMSHKHETFWYRVLNVFNSKKLQKRTKDMLTSKWHTLNANCQKFNDAYKQAKRLGKSGENDVDVMKRAQRVNPIRGVNGAGLRLKRETAERAFEAQAEKDRTLLRLEELRFLATSTKDLDDDDAYWIKKQKQLIKNKMKNDLGDENDEDEYGSF